MKDYNSSYSDFKIASGLFWRFFDWLVGLIYLSSSWAPRHCPERFSDIHWPGISLGGPWTSCHPISNRLYPAARSTLHSSPVLIDRQLPFCGADKAKRCYPHLYWEPQRVCDCAAALTTQPGLLVGDIRCQSSPPQIHCCACYTDFAKARELVRTTLFPAQMHGYLHGFSA